MSSTLEPVTTNYSSTSLDVLTVNAPEAVTPMTKSDKVILLHQLQKKNKQSVANFMSKTIKESLGEEMLELIETNNSVRFTSAIRQSFYNDSLLSMGDAKEELSKFEFSSAKPFSKTVKCQLFLKGGSHNGYAIVHIPAFVPVDDLDVPEEATNFKLVARLVSISDFEYSYKLNAYYAKDADVHGQAGQFETTMLPVLKIQTQPITKQISLDWNEHNYNASTVLVVALKFYSYSKGKFTHLADSGSMKVMKVF